LRRWQALRRAIATLALGNLIILTGRIIADG
jgi:hypothetical protein